MMGEKTKSSQCVEIEPLVTWNSKETYRSMLLNVDAGVFQVAASKDTLNWLGACIKHSGSLGFHFRLFTESSTVTQLKHTHAGLKCF